jgi:hypothetical protein
VAGWRSRIRVVWAAAVLLFAAALAVRGIEVEPPAPPEDRVADRPRIQAPMQLLAGGARERVAELDPWVSEEWRPVWKASRGIVFAIEGCPELVGWMEGSEGLRVERLLEGLRKGSREDALASLALIFQLARATDWAPGLRGRPQHAEKLAGLIASWLRRWGDASAADPLLHEPALAAALAYGRIMRIAWKAPVVGSNQAAYARATEFLEQLCGLGSRERRPFGAALQARYARAFELLGGTEDRLRGLSEEAAVLFPDLQGGCD